MRENRQTVGVQFSGNPKVYDYVIVTQADLMCITSNKNVRVVVPTGLKENGELKLSIATVVEVHPQPKDNRLLKPVITALPPLALNIIAAGIKMQEQMAAMDETGGVATSAAAAASETLH